MLREFINNYLEEDKSRSNKSNLIKSLISDKQKFTEINDFIKFGNFKQRLYHYIKDIKEAPKCLICSSSVNWVDKDFRYRETCSNKCSGKLNLYRNSPKESTHPILKTKEEYYNYFISGKIQTTEKTISKHYPEILEKIKYLNIDKFSEKLYCYLKDIEHKPICKHCNLNNVEFDTFSKGYHDYCSVKCSSNSNYKKNKIKETNQLKYGVDNVGEITRDKAMSTMFSKYGSHISLTNQYKEKYKKTSIKKYGVDHPFKSEKVKEKIRNKNIYLYNTEHPMKNIDILNRSLKTRSENGHIFKWSEEELKNYESYRRKVTYLSEKSYIQYKDLINPQNLERGHLTYHLDHIYPVILGFINKIDAELISNYKNLQLLPHDENRSKGDRTDMTLENFYQLISI